MPASPLPAAAAALVSRHRLGLAPATLGVLHAAAESALNVPAARAALASSGRAAAAAKLTGRRTRALKVKTEALKVVVSRAVDLTPRAPSLRTGGVLKKRRSGRSNWPKNAAERAAWMQRRALRDARRAGSHAEPTAAGGSAGTGAPATAVGGGEDAPYRPTSQSELEAFAELVEAVAAEIGVEPHRVVSLAVRASMSSAATPLDPRLERMWWRRHRADEPSQVQVALVPHTPALRVRAALGDTSGRSQVDEPLDAAEMLCLRHESEPWVALGTAICVCVFRFRSSNQPLGGLSGAIR